MDDVITASEQTPRHTQCHMGSLTVSDLIDVWSLLRPTSVQLCEPPRPSNYGMMTAKMHTASNMQLHIQYSGINTATLHSFSFKAVQRFQVINVSYQVSILNSVFKMSTSCSTQQMIVVCLTLPAQHITAEPISSTGWQIILWLLKLQFFVVITCFYHFSPKSLVAKCVNTLFVFITHFAHHNSINNMTLTVKLY